MGSLNCQNCAAWKRSPFAHLSGKELESLASRKSSTEFSPGQKLHQANGPADHAHCIASGHVKVVQSGNRGEEAIVRLVSSGEMTGYRCLFSEERFRASSVTLGPVFACKIPKEEILRLVRTDSSFAEVMLKRMGQEIAAAEARLHSFVRKTVRERLAETLCLLAERSGVEVSEGIELRIPLSREDLSQWVGSAMETVVRTLSDFKAEGLLHQSKDYLVIRDLKKLRAIGL